MKNSPCMKQVFKKTNKKRDQILPAQTTIPFGLFIQESVKENLKVFPWKTHNMLLSYRYQTNWETCKDIKRITILQKAERSYDFNFQNLVSVEFAVFRTVLEEPVSRFIMTGKKLDCDWQRTGQFIVNFLFALQYKLTPHVYNFLSHIINEKSHESSLS